MVEHSFITLPTTCVTSRSSIRARTAVRSQRRSAFARGSSSPSPIGQWSWSLPLTDAQRKPRVQVTVNATSWSADRSVRISIFAGFERRSTSSVRGSAISASQCAISSGPRTSSSMIRAPSEGSRAAREA
jgi:hypothetical protein